MNPHGYRSRDLGIFVLALPYIPAHDIAGDVVKIGPGHKAAEYQVGEHVFALSRLPIEQDYNDFYGLQQYALVDPWFAAKVSETGLSDDEAATIPTNVASVFVAPFHSTGFGLLDQLTDKPKSDKLSDQAILIIGAGSNCGRTAVRFAKMSGFGTIVAHAGTSNEEELKAMGATHFVSRHADNTFDRIRSIVGDELVYGLDVANWGPQQGLGIAALSNSKKGTLITLLPVKGDLEATYISSKDAGYDRRMIGGEMSLIPDFAPEFWTRITKWAKEGIISPGKFSVIEGLDADRIKKALDLYGNGKGSNVQVHP